MNYAYEFKAAKLVGMNLTTIAGQVGWMGNSRQWNEFTRYKQWHAEHGRFPHDSRPYREVEPNVFLK